MRVKGSAEIIATDDTNQAADILDRIEALALFSPTFVATYPGTSAYEGRHRPVYTGAERRSH